MYLGKYRGGGSQEKRLDMKKAESMLTDQVVNQPMDYQQAWDNGA